jgi:hypothetical protein
VFASSGFSDAAPYRPPVLEPNKENRVRDTITAAIRRPQRARELVEGLLAEMRIDGCFLVIDDPTEERWRAGRVRAAQAAFARIDWELTDDGELQPAGVATVSSVVGRPAIDDQLQRLRRASDDPALLIGTAKEMLESTAKYVLDAFSVSYKSSTDFDQLWFHARDRLGLHPKDVDASQPGGKEVREILEASWSIARMVKVLRNAEGTGHGRTLPTVMTSEMALLVVREACSVAELVLSTLDRQMGR